MSIITESNLTQEACDRINKMLDDSRRVKSSSHPDQTQVALVYDFMRRGHSIESAEAFQRWGITRLASVIEDLRRHYTITTEMIKFRAKSGQTSRFARYRLVNKSTLQT